MKRNKGITLIALVVTIVVLLILAGISISMLGGENGIITKAQEAKEENRGGTVEERRDLWKTNQMSDENTNSNTTETLDELLEDLENEGLLTSEEVAIIKDVGVITIGSHVIDFTDGEIDWSKMQPGLYETGTRNMIKSWEELKNEGSISVEGTSLISLVHELNGDLVISNEITKIDGYLLPGQCGWIFGANVTGIYIPDTVESIGEMAFAGFENLKKINIPLLITEISEGTFYKCTNLMSIEIPNSVTVIGENAFFHCSSLTSIKVEEGNEVFDSRNNSNAIIETNTNTLLLGCKNTIIPNSVTSIGDSAFEWQSNLTSIEIPNNVTSIGNRAFYGCDSLKNIKIPSTVITIRSWAFLACDSLTTVDYTGTRAEWNTLLSSIQSENENLINAKIICTDGEIN